MDATYREASRIWQETMMQPYKYFPDHELACRCGCGGGRPDMIPAFMARLIRLREDFGRPMVVSSAYRCPKHNGAVSSTDQAGPHTTGRAVDILIYGEAALKLIEKALQHGFTGIGISQNGTYGTRFIHLDDLTTSPRPWVWSY